jgi:hypothetical protein
MLFRYHAGQGAKEKLVTSRISIVLGVIEYERQLNIKITSQSRMA